ncbi:Pentapeptide repeat family protein [hydrothermal vent metagenome]|uniref:Pentapeptide repeat family protein n=1 Tax=hydrothermal vent metagenome TaxID=652676 RepID=A0A3B1A5J7_9ZZZZ
MSAQPKITQDPLYQLLREGKIEEFNKSKAAGGVCDLTHCDFRNLNLQNLEANGLDFTGGYFRQTDLRGVDLSNAKMEGASINGARISGVYFPKELSAGEIKLSIEHGTRMRYSKI